MRNIGLSFESALKFVGFLWLVSIINLIFPVDLRLLGIHPRTIIGLVGIIFSPFLHSSISHLIGNSIPLLILLTVSNALGREITARAIVFIILVSGAGTWLFGEPGIHLGASGLAMGLTGFLMFLGFYRRSRIAIFISVCVFFSSGVLVLVNLIPKEGISWTGHFFGFIAGIIAAKQNGHQRSES